MYNTKLKKNEPLPRACLIVQEERTQEEIVACSSELVHTHVVFVKEQVDAVTEVTRHLSCFIADQLPIDLDIR